MRLPDSAHTSQPWRIHELTADFRLEDVWALPTPGGPGDFPRLMKAMAATDPAQSSSRAVSALFAIRWKVGELFGWDDPGSGLGARVPTLRDRLPADLRDAAAGPEFGELPFVSLYLLRDEWAAEIANRTVHGVMHMSWVPDGTGGYRGQMAVLVKPNGRSGKAYMAAIKPFRHLLVYPAMLREIGRAWSRSSGPWTVLYDSDCGFCKWLLSGLLRWDRAARLRPLALQRPEAAELLHDLTPAERMASWHLISPAGRRHSGGAALPHLLRLLPAGRLPSAAFARIPRLSDRGYRWVAEHRSQLSKLVPSGAKARAAQRVRERES
jgi:predicted DCC family thiol-disulfide oxidoreductase YuxK